MPDRSATVRLECLLALLAMLAGLPRMARSESLWTPCAHCLLLIGVGTTYYDFNWTRGLVLPVTLELDDSRWELGVFRFQTQQHAPGAADIVYAHPYWGLTAMRRWQVLHRGWGRLYLGFGANYRTELDYLEATHWNFAYLIAVRFGSASGSGSFELGVRHWSDAWLKKPNRGQDLVTLSYAF